MKLVISVGVATALLFGIFGGLTWTPGMGGFDMSTTIAMSASFGALIGCIIGATALCVRKLIGQ